MIPQFTITHDHISRSDEPSAVGTVGPRTATMTHEEIAAHPKGERFRMKDDDGNIYYEGVMLGGQGFHPLDCFGAPNAGCTTIEYLENGKWEVL